MSYIQELRGRAGDLPLILVRPTLILLNHDGAILLVKHEDDTWGLPGGLLEPGESTEETVRRELDEELNITIGELKHFNVFSGDGFYKKSIYGTESHYIAVAYIANQYSNEIKPDNVEVVDYGFFKPDEMPDNLPEMNLIIIKQFEESIY